MKGNVPTMNPTNMLNRKITTCSTMTKERNKKLQLERSFFFPQRSSINAENKKIEVTEPSYLQMNPWRDAIQCIFCDQVFLSEAFPTDELCSSGRSTGRINRIHNVRARPPFYRADSHRGHLFFDFSIAAALKTSCSVHKCSQCVSVCRLCCRCGDELKQEAVLQGAHHLAVALIQLPLRSYALPIHMQPAYRILYIWCVFFDLIKCIRCNLQQIARWRLKLSKYK